MLARGKNGRYGALLLALAALLSPVQVAQANIDLPGLKEAVPAELIELAIEAPRLALPLTRFMSASHGVELGLAEFAGGLSLEPKKAEDAPEARRRLRFASADYAPYLPGLSAIARPWKELAPLSSDGTPTAVFGSVAIPVSGSVHAARWRHVLAEQAHLALAAPCMEGGRDCGNAVMQKARGIVREARELERDAKVKLINRFVNTTIRYGTDLEVYGVDDHWATLAETFARGRGDCEDIAIVKMWMLRAAGIDPADMHLSLGRQTRLREDHAILVVKAEAQRNYYLDNLTARVEAAEGRGEFQPLVSYGMRGAWIHGYKVTRQF